ncbi:MAG: DUF2019 domain-containing protein [Pirellulales bacterium]
MNRIDNLVDRFAELVLLRSAALKRADSDEANRHSRELATVFRRLASRGDAGRNALGRLFEHESRAVRSTAAAWLLRHKHDDAMRVLRDVALGGDMEAFCAQQCIKRWEEGEWQLDPPPTA